MMSSSSSSSEACTAVSVVRRAQKCRCVGSCSTMTVSIITTIDIDAWPPTAACNTLVLAVCAALSLAQEDERCDADFAMGGKAWQSRESAAWGMVVSKRTSCLLLATASVATLLLLCL